MGAPSHVQDPRPTETFTPDGPSGDDLGLTIVHHPDPQVLGAAMVPTWGTTVELGRHCAAFGTGHLAVAAVSRRHATLACSPSGELAIHDQGSRNGTLVNGAAVVHGALRHGDVVRIGSLLLLVARGSASGAAPPGLPGFVGFSDAWAKLVRVATALAERRDPVLICGPSGSGRHALAAAIVDPAVLSRPTQPPPSWPAHGAVRVDLDRWLWTDVERLLDGRAPDGARPILLSTRSPQQLGTLDGPPTLLSAAAPWTLLVPPLAERPADVAALIWAFCRRFGGPAAHPSHALIERLLRTPLATNVHRLEAFVERAVLESNQETIDAFAGLDAALAIGGATPVASVPPPRLTIARSGAWLQAAGQAKADVSTRPLLQRLAKALLDARLERTGEALDVEALFAAGWPGDRTRGSSRTNRVYVALTKLRKLGLSEVLVRRADGYCFDPACSVDVDDS